LRDVLLVEAVEALDQDGGLIGPAEREDADRRARAVLDGAAGPEEGAPLRFVEERARVLREGLVRARPELARLLRWAAAPSPPSAAVFLLAVLAGLGADRLEGSQRLNLLSFSLLTILAWNLVGYPVRALASLARRAGWLRPRPWGRLALWLAGAERLWAPRRRAGGDLGVAIHGRFLAGWGRHAAPVAGARLRAAVDLAAAGLALGVLGGVYLRGLVHEYRAGWESTFLDAEAVHALLGVLLAPGALLSGRAVPGPEALAAMQGAGAGAPAAEWIHLFAASCVALAIAPRLALAGWSALRARRLEADLDLDTASYPLLARALAGERGGGLRVDLSSYSYGLSVAAEEGLRNLAAQLFGGRAAQGAVRGVAYGDPPGAGEGERRVLVFNAAQCPEREVHGTFVAELVAATEPGADLLVVVDESTFARRAGIAAPERVAGRRRAWSEVLGERRVEAVFCDLEEEGSLPLEGARAALWTAAEGEA
jgi:hypothetical protein